MAQSDNDWHKIAILLSLLFIIYSLESCTLPMDEDPVQWEFSLTVPAIQKEVHMVKTLDSLINETEDGKENLTLLQDSSVRIEHKDTTETAFDLLPFFSSVTAVEEQTMGLLTLSGLGETVLPLTLQGRNIIDPHTVQLTIPMKSELFQSLSFDATSPALSLSLQNQSPTNSIHSAQVILLHEEQQVSTGTSTAPILPNTIGIISLPLAEKEISVSSSLQVTLQFQNPLTPADQAALSFSFDGAIVKKGILQDQLLPDIIEVPLEKELTDSLYISNILFNSITLNCTIENNLQMQTTMNGIIYQSDGTEQTLWSTAPLVVEGSQKINSLLQPVILLPHWDAEEAKSILKLSFQMTPHKSGQLYHFDAENSIAVTLSLNQMNFNRVSGSFPQGLTQEVDADQWELPQLFSFYNQQEVVGKMITKGSTIRAEIATFNDNISFLDSLEVAVRTQFGNILGTSEEDTLKAIFSGLFTGKVDTVTASVDQIINSLPNMLQGALTITIPPNASFTLAAQEQALLIPVSVINRMEIPLQYEIHEAMNILSEVHTMEIPNEQLQVVNKLDDPAITLSVTIENSSPLSLSLFGMGSGLEDSTLLDAIENEQFTQNYIELMGLEKELFYMTGNEELLLSDSGSTAVSSWTIRGEALNKFIENDSICARFLVKMPATTGAEISTESSLLVKTAITIDGLMSSDNLIDEEEEQL